MSKIVISGYYGYDNIGDEAILAGIITSLRREDNSLQIVVLSNQPELTAQRYGVESIYRNNIKEIIGELSHCDLFLSGGGSLLQDVTSWRTIPYYLGLVFLAQLIGKKTVFYAQGVGPIKRNFGRMLVRIIANRTDLITVRDEQSSKLLKEIGVKPDLIKITADPVFSLGEDQKNFSNDLRQELGIGGKPLIGISVKSWHNNSYLQTIAEAADSLADKNGGSIVIIPMHYQQDQQVSREVKSLIKHKSIILTQRYDPFEMLAFFSQFDFLIGVRLHSLIFAVLNKIPFVAVSYDPKIEGFLNLLGINSFVKIDNIKKENLAAVCEVVWSRRDQITDLLNKKTALFAKQNTVNAKLILQMLNKPV